MSLSLSLPAQNSEVEIRLGWLWLAGELCTRGRSENASVSSAVSPSVSCVAEVKRDGKIAGHRQTLELHIELMSLQRDAINSKHGR